MVQNPEAMQEESEIFDTKINLCVKYLAKTNIPLTESIFNVRQKYL